jgi:hypothetical protein
MIEVISSGWRGQRVDDGLRGEIRYAVASLTLSNSSFWENVMLSKYEPFTPCSSRLPCEQVHQLTFPIDYAEPPQKAVGTRLKSAGIPSTSGEKRFRVGEDRRIWPSLPPLFHLLFCHTDKPKSQIISGTSDVSANMQVFGSLPQIFHLADYRMRNRCIHTAE